MKRASAPPRTQAALLALSLVLLPALAAAQVFVVPRRPEKSLVRNFRSEWRHVDILVGPSARGEAKDGSPHGGPRTTTPLGPTTGSTSVPCVSNPPPNAAPAVDPAEAAQPPGLGEPAAPVAGAAGADGGVAGGPSGEALPDGGIPGTTDPAAAPGGGVRYWAPLAPDGGTAYAKSLGDSAGGVRLYFYEREREVAERAVPIIEDAYRYLVERFQYVPEETFPYILYSSYAEFLQSNVFMPGEGTLGVTNIEDLKLSLPYLGDNRLFEEVGAHELTHQFTIQKVRSVAKRAGRSGNPLEKMPLWFIEGLAEFYAKRGLDPEAEMLVRDLLVNPDVYKGYAFLDFWSEGPYGYLWIYKAGQARVAFLSEVYGEGIIQQLLEQSPRMLGGGRDSPSMEFKELVEQLTGDKPERVADRFQTWLKRRSFRTYLSAQQDAPALDQLEERSGIVTALNASPDGNTVAYRSIMPNTGQSRLYVAHRLDPKNPVLVQGDGQPGYESLHPIFGRNFDLTDGRLIFLAQSGGRDVLYVQDLHVSVEERQGQILTRTGPLSQAAVRREIATRTDVELGDRRKYKLADKGVLAAFSPALSPDGKSVAFIGIDDRGVRDVYVLKLESPEEEPLVKLTNDEFTERMLTWGPSGIIYNSDATGHRFFNLFRVRPEAPLQAERLTTEERDHNDPEALADGRVYFVAYDQSHSNLYELTADKALVRRTDVATGLFEPAAGPDGGLWVLEHRSGERVPSVLRRERFLNEPQAPQPTGDPPLSLARRALGDAQPYRPWASENFEFGPILGFAGGGTGGIYGQLFAMATDKLKNQAMLLQTSVYGSFELTDGYALYLNQERRATWGIGAFQQLRYREDFTFRQERFTFNSGERFFGVLGTIRYPMSTFTSVSADLSLGAVDRFLFDIQKFYLSEPSQNPLADNILSEWNAANRGVIPQAEGTVALGYDTTRYVGGSSPLSGSGILLEVTGGTQPTEGFASFSNIRLDAERYFPIEGRVKLMARFGAGTSMGGDLARSFFLSSFDTLRGVEFGDEFWLLGRHYFYSTAELQVPLNSIVQVAFLSDMEGIAGVDFGSTAPRVDQIQDLFDKRVLNAVLGVNFGLGPLMLRLHFARPFDIRAPAGLPIIEELDGKWRTNFSIGIAGMPGFFFNEGDKTRTQHRPTRSPFRGPAVMR